ncbi:FkbM family methyltransferase [Butyrivibrio sp. JL13D10]|uniref:FkbM family methyltransferase n=1 Tax=Butyrivibrio sp. JL13D10 TaxID=3236815 RepID=UPI0038B5FECD
MYIDYLKKLFHGKKICIFPMGIAGKSLYDKLESIGIRTDFFCDNNPQKYGSGYKGCFCITKKELAAINKDTIIIVESLYYREIKKQLTDEGFCNIERIFFEKINGEKYIVLNKDEFDNKRDSVCKILADTKSVKVYQKVLNAYEDTSLKDDYFSDIYDKNQYFDNELIKLIDDEVFVDLGAYTGDSAAKFIEMSNGVFEKLHLFELDPNIYKRLMLNVAGLYEKTKNGIIQCYPYGVSDVDEDIEFYAGDSSSKIIKSIDKGVETITGKVKKLDEILKGEKVTFIKADIEGAELSALNGAKDIICSQKPILAFCIYHSIQDTLDIPIWIYELGLEYKIYIRHYTDMFLETVCYAIPKWR